MSFISIIEFQNHLFSVPSGRKWREKREMLEAVKMTDTRGDLDLEISDKSVGNSGK